MTEVKNRLSTRNLIIILACIVLYFLITAIPLPEGEGALTIQGLKAIALMVCALIFWIWQRSASPSPSSGSLSALLL